MSFILRFRVVRIDHDGYCGRENHPSDSDIGLSVRVVGFDTEEHEIDGERFEETCYTCRTEDGRTLDLMEHEVEVLELTLKDQTIIDNRDLIPVLNSNMVR